MDLFHGTPGAIRGNAILREGLKADQAPDPDPDLRPLSGRIYFAQDPMTAIRYAQCRSRNDWGAGVAPDDTASYLFKVTVPNNSHDVLLPDEDHVGEALFAAFDAEKWLVATGKKNPFGPYSILSYGNEKLCHAVYQEQSLAAALRSLARDILDDNLVFRVAEMNIENPNGDVLASAGREILPSMSPHLKAALIERGTGVSLLPEHAAISEAWHVDCNERIDNWEHFIATATSIPVSQHTEEPRFSPAP